MIGDGDEVSLTADKYPGTILVRVDGAGHSDVHQFPTVRKALASALGRL